MNPLMTPYHDTLMAALQEPEEAIAYLNAALEENDPAVLALAFQHLAEAHGLTALLTELSCQSEHISLRQLTPLLHALHVRFIAA